MSFIDRFIHDRFKQDADLVYKVRLLVAGLMCFIASVIGFGPVYAMIPGLPSGAVEAYFFIGFPPLLLWFYLLKLLQKGKAYRLSSHSVVASLTALLFAGVGVTGGPTMTEVHPLLIMPLIVAFLLLGQKSGLIWTLIIGAIYYAMLIMSSLGVEFINLPPEDVRGKLRIFNWSYAFFITAALILVYESINKRVTRERDAEREKFRHIASVAVGSSVVNESADSLSTTGDQLLKSAIDQKVAIEQLVTTTEELNATADQNSALAKEATESIKATEQSLSVSKEDIFKLFESMNEVKASSEEIFNINSVINEISYQTNLLSLNAMIEASRAGEGNGGFKVVAMEVKKLAERSADAAENINKLLDRNLGSVTKGANLSELMRERFEEITASIEPLLATIQNVSDASYEQNAAIRQITSGLADIDMAIEENKQLADKASKAATELRDNATSLLSVVEDLGAELDHKIEAHDGI